MEENKEQRTCCFFGHRKIKDSEALRKRLKTTIEDLIVNQSVDTFLFGSRSTFDLLCREIVASLKETYPFISRIYIRAEYQYVSDSFRDLLFKEGCDDTYFPEHLENAGKASYIERNQEMINKSQFCIVYYNKNYLPPRRKYNKRNVADYQPNSGTALAYHYAVKKRKKS